MSTCTKPRARAPLPSAVDRRTPSPRPSRTLETRMRGEIFHLKFRSSSPERMTRIGSSSPDDWDLRGNTDTLTMTRGAAVAACEARNARCKKKGSCPHRRACEEQNRRGAKSGPARVEFRISPARSKIGERSKISPRASGISNFDKNCASRGAPRWVHPSHTTGCEAGGERCGDFVQNAFGQIRTGDLSCVRRTD